MRSPIVLPSTFASLVLVGAVSAQRTWVVSATGGPGVDFTDTAPAVAAAADGDIIVVRPGQYTSAQIDGKGLTLAGEPGVRIGMVTVNNLAASQRVVVADVELASALPVTWLGAQNALGLVLFERISMAMGSFPTSIQNCADARLSQFRSGRQLLVSDSQVTITDSAVDSITASISGEAIVSLTRSQVTLSRCQFRGAPEAIARFVATAAISMTDSTVMATDDGSNVIAAGAAQFLRQPSAVVGSGTFVRDTRVRVSAGSAPPVAGPIEVVRNIPTLRALPAGGNVDVVLSGAAGEVYALFLGLPGPPVPFPQFGGSIGLSTLTLVAQGTFTAAPFQLSLPRAIGHSPGFALAWQAIAVDTQLRLQLSNFATYARTR